MKLSTVIVNYNSGDNLKECLRNIPKEYETIVIDNNSSDSSLSKIKSERVTLIKNRENLGFAKAVNLGIKIANGKNILLMNPDVKLKKDTIAKTLDFLEKKQDANIVGCRLANPDGSPQYSCRRFPTFTGLISRKIFGGKVFKKSFDRYLMKDYGHKEPRKVDWVSGAFLMMKGKRMLDEKFFMYFEDTDLCKRVGGVYYFPQAAAIHGNDESSGSLGLKITHFSSMLRYFWKHL